MQGLISQVLGPVVDVDFKDYLPQINEALTVNFEAEGKKTKARFRSSSAFRRQPRAHHRYGYD